MPLNSNVMMLNYLLNDEQAGSEKIGDCQMGWQGSIMSAESSIKVLLSIMLTCTNKLAATVG
jgi:hypothetical protein